MAKRGRNGGKKLANENAKSLTQAVTLLEATLKEEKATDAALTQIAETVVNQEAQAAAE
jgi:ferritin-like metal-binding protein YciE